MSKTFLVTVGTTKFENLIKSIDTPDFYKLLDDNNFSKIIIQKGFGEFIPSKFKELKFKNLNVEVNELISNFEDVIKNSDFIISHGGAGNILESLKYKKILFVVVNDLLMDNHQVELAEALAKDNYVYYIKSTQDVLIDVKKVIQNSENNLKEYPDFNLDIIPNIIYDMLDL